MGLISKPIWRAIQTSLNNFAWRQSEIYKHHETSPEIKTNLQKKRDDVVFKTKMDSFPFCKYKPYF